MKVVTVVCFCVVACSATRTQTFTETRTFTETQTLTETVTLATGTETATVTLGTGTWSMTETPTETMSREMTLTDHTLTETLQLGTTAKYLEAFASNSSLSSVHPMSVGAVDPDYWVDPPYSLRIDGGVAVVKFGAGVARPHSASWWFRVSEGTLAAHFYLTTDWFASGHHGYNRPHLLLSANTKKGFFVDTGFEKHTCSEPGTAYAVVHNTWHLLTVAFNFGTNNTLGAAVDVSLDGAALCQGVYWNHTEPVLKAVHAAPELEFPEPWCGNLTANTSCVDAGPGQFLDCGLEEEDCRACCRAATISERSRGCCEYNTQTRQCWFSRSTETVANYTSVNDTLAVHYAAPCILRTGTLHLDRVHLCEREGECEAYHHYRPFNCSLYGQNHRYVEHSNAWGDAYDCMMHPRCTWHSVAQVCVEDPLSELRNAWLAGWGNRSVWEGGNVLSLDGFVSVGEATWRNSSDDWVALEEVATEQYFPQKGVAVLRSPPFRVGWYTTVTVGVNSTEDLYVGTDNIEGEVSLNMSTFSNGFLGTAIQWNNGWVSQKRLCVGYCTITYTAADLRLYVDQEVTLDIIDNAYKYKGDFAVRWVVVANASSHVPVPFGNWTRGLPCGGAVDWEGITCIDNQVANVTLPTKGLSGHLGTVDLSALGNTTYVDLSDNQLSGAIDERLLPSSVEYLYLGGNLFTGTFPKFTYGTLTHLNLSHQDLEGSLPQYLDWPRSQYTYCPYGLVSLDVSHTQVNWTLSDKLARHPTLQEFRCRYCGLSGTIPVPLGKHTTDFEVGYNGLSGIAPYKAPGGEAAVTNVGLAHNELVGLIPDWIRHARNFSLEGNNWCCPVPHWARRSPYYAVGEPKSLAKSREDHHNQPVITCARVASTDPAHYGSCPTVVGPCDGSITCGHQSCSCDMRAFIYSDPSIPQHAAHTDARCPSYEGCGCDMRRHRCIFRTHQPQCNFTTSTTNDICVDEGHLFDRAEDPAHDPYYGDIHGTNDAKDMTFFS